MSKYSKLITCVGTLVTKLVLLLVKVVESPNRTWGNFS